MSQQQIIESYKDKAKLKFSDLAFFCSKFVAIFLLIWGFIEPYGGLCKIVFFRDIPNCENNIHIPYSILIIISLFVAIVIESIRLFIQYRRMLIGIVNDLSKNIIEIDTKNSEIEKEKIEFFFLSKQTEEEFYIPRDLFNAKSYIFIENFLTVCEWLGLYEENNKMYKSKGYLSCFIIKSMYSSISHSVKLFNGIQLHQGDQENKQIKNLLKQMEVIRISTAEFPRPIRDIQSSIVIIMALDRNRIPRFLLQHSSSWSGGYYWWIGGIQEPRDLNSTECAKRELNEELGIKPINIRGIKLEGTISENIISDRVGAYTNYSYNIFTLILKNTEGISELLKLENTIDLPLEGYKIKRQIKWYTWEDIWNNQDLQRDAGSILRFINENKLFKDSISTEKIIE